MRGIGVELSRPGMASVTYPLEDYERLPIDMVTDSTVTLVFDCDRCKIRHELGSFEQFLAAITRAAEHRQACVAEHVQ